MITIIPKRDPNGIALLPKEEFEGWDYDWHPKKKPFIILYSMMILDYILTKIGLFYGIIAEGNLLMMWLVNLPILIGFPIRLIMSFLLLLPIYLVIKTNPKLHRIALTIAFVVNIFIMLMHLLWIVLLII